MHNCKVKRELSVFDKHRIKVLKSCVNTLDVFNALIGPYTQQQARDILLKEYNITVK
jgi:hypothetical protein